MNGDIKKLVAAMTIEEKASFVSGADYWHTKKIERLGIPDMMVSDGPCGLRKQEDATDGLTMAESKKSVSYPTGSCIACSFDRDLLKECGEALGDEALAEGIGILLGPAVNIKRSPLCGRNFEYFSEDPYLSGELAKAYINGVQSKGVGTSVKHFAANSQEYRRLTDSSDVDERTLREIYFPAFEKAVKESGPWSVMCSYNRINGEYASENSWLLNTVLRDEWGFDGFVVSDWGAVNDRIKGVSSGLDLEMPGPGKYSARKIIEAIDRGELEEKYLDKACERVLSAVYRYADSGISDKTYDIEDHHKLAERIADESVVLLKNKGSLLPLSKGCKAAYIGKFAQKPTFQGGGSSKVNSYKIVSALDAASEMDVIYSDGTDLKSALKAARESEVAIVFVGTTEEIESEGFDRADISLPVEQTDLIKAVSEVQKNLIVVVHAGSCIEMPWIDKVGAVIYAYMGGEAVGQSIVNVLYGNVNPSGRIAETFPVRIEDNPSYIWYHGENDHTQYKEGVFVGYRWYDKINRDVLFPFGYGLSYTEFEYSNISLDSEIMNGSGDINVSVKIKNTGRVSGKETVQLYVKNPCDKVIRPVRELKGFEKIYLEPGEEKTVSFVLDKRAFAYYDVKKHGWSVEDGEYYIEVGRNSRDIVLSKCIQVCETEKTKKIFSMNSTIGDVLSEESAFEAFSELFMSVMKTVGFLSDEYGTEDLNLILKSVSDFPLRDIFMLFGEAVTHEMIEEVLEKLNSK